ncbi:MAG: hypothetical protein AAF846_01660 [Chloroflexota bacterium]
MEVNSENRRWNEIVQLWEKYPLFYGLLVGFLLGLIAFPALPQTISEVGSLLAELFPEAMGILFTVFFLDRIYAQRNEQQQLKSFKEKLIREAGSPANTTALHAFKELKNHDWLKGKDGLL